MSQILVDTISDERKGISWVKWDTMCEPKLHGGLGFRKFKCFN